jgi:uncharacterized protein YkwD
MSPKVIEDIAMILRSLIVVLFAAGLLPPAASRARDSEKPDLAQVAKRIVQLTNEFRKKEGLSHLEGNDKLKETAVYFADFMARTGKYGHTADDQQPADRAKKHGYEYCLISENIAYQYSSAGFATEKLANAFVEGWKESPGHRKNMLDSDVMEIGVSIARSSDTGRYYAVQMFGRPKSKAIEFRFANQSDQTVKYEIEDRSFELQPRMIRTHQQCRPTEVRFRWPDDKGEPTVVRPSNGERFVVVKENGTFRMKKELSQ